MWKALLHTYSPASKETTSQSLPASWYRDESLYSLERRAIFSKHWLLITHYHRFAKPGDYLAYEIAGFPFFLCLDRGGILNGFHNVCRHRAFPVVTQEKGNASIFSCKYHGWSYSLKGDLTKAPRFESVETFRKANNGLLPVHVHVDSRGFVWVNLEQTEKPTVQWNESFAGSDKHERLDDFNMDDFTFDHTWDVKGEYNWKAMSDNYNECYHCGVAHPGIAAVSDLETYYVETEKGQIRHFVKDKPEVQSDMNFAPTFFFPNNTVSMTTHYFYIMRAVPTSPTTTWMQYDVYRHKDATEQQFREVDDFYKQVEHEDIALCNAAQKNLNAGAYVAGELHPFHEKGVLHFQQLVRTALLAHTKQEAEAGTHIWPAQKTAGLGKRVEAEMEFCKSSSCEESNKGHLQW